ncbi:MAG: molecular chaperone (small heat shock protein) [bacterium]|nr:MAG: molecular chaperone (small heat shock protein) [bacterium]
MTKKNDKESNSGFDIAFGGILKGLGSLVEKLGEMAETSHTISNSKTGEINGQELKGIYGFSVKFGLGNEPIKVEPFGNIRKDKTTGQASVEEMREPIIDIFEEEDHVLIIAEMPGVSIKDVKFDIKDDILSIYAERGSKKYHKEILLPRSFQPDNIKLSSNNGVVEIKCLIDK